MEYHFSDAYALVAATDMKVFFELRSYDQDQVLDSMVLSSRYMIPEFEAIDAGKRGPQFMVQTRDGGTGLGETHLALFGVVGQHFHKYGDFVISRSEFQDDLGSDSYREELSGSVSFINADELIYHYKQVVTRDKTTTTNSAVEFYSFDTKTVEYERKRQP